MEKTETTEMKMQLVELKSRQEILEDRFDRHLADAKADIKGLRADMVQLNVAITTMKVDIVQGVMNARLDQLKDDRETKIKLYTLSGVVSIIVSILTSALALVFKSKITP